VKRALVVFPGALGDFVCLLPAIAEMRRAGFERIVLACKSDLAPLVAAGGIAEPMPIEGRQASWLFQAEPPREAEAFYSTFDRIESFSGAGIAEVEGNLRRWAGSRARVHPFRPPPRTHLAVHFLERTCGGCRAADEIVVELGLPADAVARAHRAVADLARPLLLVHTGSGGQSKRWSRSGFAEVVVRARQRGSVLVVTGPAEGAEEVAYWRARGIPVLEGIGLLELAALSAVADRYLGNDSGVSHLAAAVGACGVALFGPTDPALWRPLSPRIMSLRLEPWAEADEDAPAASLECVWSALESSKAERLDKVGPRH